MSFPIIFKNKDLVVIDKPEGFHVHPHEVKTHRVSKEQTCLYLLRRQINQWVYPVHRLDAATSGLLVFALSSESAHEFHQMLQNQSVQKKYLGVARGYLTGDQNVEIPLPSEKGDKELPAQTLFHNLKTLEINAAIGKYPQSRYSLLQAIPVTGRFHQIRRHLTRLAHPLIGDFAHGDRYHNRYFRDQLRLPGLCLRAQSLRFSWQGEELYLEAPVTPKWQRLFEMFDYENQQTSSHLSQIATSQSLSHFDLIQPIV